VGSLKEHSDSEFFGSRFIDWFVPDTVKADPERRRRSNLVVASAIGLGVMALPLGLLNYSMVGSVSPSVTTFALSMAVLLLCAMGIRTGVHERTIGALITFDMLFALSVMSYYNGGIHSASLIWMIPVPLVGQFLRGRRFGLLCAVLIAIELVAFYVLYQRGMNLPMQLSPDGMVLFR